MTKRGLILLPLLALLLVDLSVRADIISGLVAYYDFEGLTGTVGETVADRSGNGHDGVCRQDQNTLRAPMQVAGPIGLGQALSFDGYFYVQIPNHTDFDLTTNITVAAWVSVDTFDQDWQTIFSRGDWSWRLHRRQNTDNATLGLTGLSGGNGANGYSNIRLPKRWVHLVATYTNGAGATLYVNGSIETNSAISGAISTSGSDPVTIGSQINAGTLRRQWKGQIDEVRLYSRALSAGDVAELYGLVLTNANSQPTVTVPATLALSVPTNVLLVATAMDDGNPLPANPANPDPNDPNKLRWGWSVVSLPAASAGVSWSGNPSHGEAFTYLGSPNLPGTVFTNSPTVTFDVPGLYVLQFTASDGQRTVSNMVNVLVSNGTNYRSMGYSYLSPLPNAPYCAPQTRFLLVRFKNVSPASLTNLLQFIQVNGTVSGSHPGQSHIASDGRTVIFQNNTDFTAGEVVTVSLAPGVPPQAGGPILPFQYQFAVSTYMPGTPATPSIVAVPSLQLSQPLVSSGEEPAPNTAVKPLAITMPNGVSVPTELPLIKITVNDNPCALPIFIDNRGGGGKYYDIIFDNNGSPLWYQKMPDERRDMRVQTNGVLTMMARNVVNHYNGFDTNYHQIAGYYATNGYGLDEHELQVRPDGTYFMVANRVNTVDMSRYVSGGYYAASVTEQIVQEFTAAGELIFQFRAWDHYDPRDEAAFINVMGSSFDFTHMNAIDIDTDGNMLLSSRNTSEVTKVDLETGEIIWRLGGVHNQFTFLNDPLNGPANQHAIRMVSTNHYTLFDNGNLHPTPMSRGVEYEVDPTNLTATVVWQYPNPATNTIYSYYMGNVQRLPNGNTLINWAVGSLPKLTEVRPDGTKAFEMNWVNNYEAYRCWRCPWQGVAAEPYLLTESYPDNVTLIFNQFGDTNVAFYRIYGGTSAHPTNLLATSGTTLKQLNTLSNGTWYFRVTSVNRQGIESAFSNEQSVNVNIIKPGQNMVINGDFSQGTVSWIWTTSGTASATFTTTGDTGYVHTIAQGVNLSDIQLRQAGLKLLLGRQYAVQFDAWSSTRRSIEVRLSPDSSPSTGYAVFSPTLTSAKQHLTYSFVMTNANDLNSRLSFNMGGVLSDVYIDNISVFNPPVGDLNLDGRVDLLDLQILTRNWLRRQTGLSGDLNSDGTVNFIDFGILGDNWTGGN